MEWRQLFLVKAWQQHKGLACLFAAFILLSFYFNFKGMENTPFFIWDMYSGKVEPHQQYRIITVTYNDGQVLNFRHTFQEPQSMMVYFTLHHYQLMEANHLQDPMQTVFDKTILPHYPFLRPLAASIVSKPADNARYLYWLKNYLASITGTEIRQAVVYEKLVHYDASSRVLEDSSKILYTIQ